MEHPMIVLTFTFYVETQLPGGPSADEVRISREFETDDPDQAHELADREWPSLKPSNYIEGTLSVIRA